MGKLEDNCFDVNLTIETAHYQPEWGEVDLVIHGADSDLTVVVNGHDMQEKAISSQKKRTVKVNKDYFL